LISPRNSSKEDEKKHRSRTFHFTKAKNAVYYGRFCVAVVGNKSISIYATSLNGLVIDQKSLR